MKKSVAFSLICSFIIIVGIFVSQTLSEPNVQETTKPLKYSGYPVEWISDIPLSEIKSIDNNDDMAIEPDMFITKSGDLYLLSTDKLFSNEQICKKVETDLKFERFLDYPNSRRASTIISADGGYYTYNKETEQIEPAYFGEGDTFIEEMNSLHPNSYGDDYYIENNCLFIVYRNYLPDDSATDSFKETIVETLIDTIPNGETFISWDGKVIKTDKAFYKIGIKNRDEVEKYADVKPIEGLEKIENVSNQYDDIKYFNGNFIIYKNDSKHIYLHKDWL